MSDAVGSELVYSAKDNVIRDNFQVVDMNNIREMTADYQRDKLTLEFLTPVRFKEIRGEKNKLTKLTGFSQIVTNTFWRLLQLAYFHCNDRSLDDEHFSGLAAEASGMRKSLMEQTVVEMVKNQTYWRDYERYSNRQKTKMKMGGFMGQATFSGNIAPYLPLLSFGQYSHIGKQTTFGLGKYKIV